MLQSRRLTGRSTLRALFLASAVALGVGVAATAVRAETVQSAPALASDRLAVQVVGAGPDVILIPGLASSRDVWTVEAQRLRATHRVHLVQLAGFAGEPWAHGDGPFVQPVVDELARYIAEQDLGRPAVIGHSMGALIGLKLAQDHPQRIGRLLSVDSLPFFSAMFGPTVTPESAAPIAAQTTAAMIAMPDDAFAAAQAQAAAGLARDPATREDIVDWSVATDRHAMAAALTDVMTTDLRPGLAGMSTPVTALYAADADGGAPAAMADALWIGQYDDLPGVTLIRIDGSRHFIMRDQPERFADAVDAFLD